jgi:hypothetical protein
MPRAKTAKPKLLDFDMHAVEQMIERIRAQVSPDDLGVICALVQTVTMLTELLRSSKTTIARMRRLFGLTGSEKLADVLPAPQTPPSNGQGTDAAEPAARPTPPPNPAARTKVKGHGRVPASAYSKAEHVPVQHSCLHAGARCPNCQEGNLHQIQPAVIVRIFGRAPLWARCWDDERLRCGACGHVFYAPLPPEAQGPKYDETAASMMALMRYGCSMPGNRLDHLQANLQSPVPGTTQWQILNERVELVRPAYDELKRQAAQGDVLHNDDSYMRILSFMGKRRAALLAAGNLPDPDRTGMYTTAIVSVVPTIGVIALFFTGRKHAGENLEQLLALREALRDPPILMSDASSRNVPDGYDVLEANCIPHGRRQIVDELPNHPAECKYLLERLAVVFHLEKELKELGVSNQVRLMAHRHESGPIMDELRSWMTAALKDNRIEPNCGLGKALNYFLKRWSKFTLFLRVPGAPLDNNIAERALKRAIGLRKGSLFYRTQRGATVGDIFMTLIYTAELHHQNPFQYLTELQRNYNAVAERPGDWMPWNYRATLAARAGPAVAVAA